MIVHTILCYHKKYQTINWVKQGAIFPLPGMATERRRHLFVVVNKMIGEEWSEMTAVRSRTTKGRPWHVGSLSLQNATLDALSAHPGKDQSPGTSFLMNFSAALSSSLTVSVR